MTSPTGSIRKLNYPLNRSEDLESSTPNDPEITQITLENWSTADTEERVSIVLNLSLDEYIALSTAIDVGRDIAYGDNSLYVWWIWVRSLLSVDICNDVLNCINTSSDIQEAIANYSLTSNVNSLTPENQGILSMQLVNNQAGCDNDNIYGMTLQLVNFVDTLIQDLLQRMIAATQSMDALGFLISAIPGVETLPLDEALEFANWLLDTIYTAYLAASTVILRTEVACDLFCIAQNNGCILTMEQARDYFNDKLGITLDTSNFGAFINDIIANNLVGVATFYGMYDLMFQLLAFGASVLDYLPERIVRMVQAMFNDPNSDWIIDCDSCNPNPDYDFDFTAGTQSWGILTANGQARGEYVAGVGFRSTLSDNMIRLAILHDFGMVINVDYAELDVIWTDNGGSLQVMNEYRSPQQGVTPGIQVEGYTVPSGGTQTITYDTNFSDDSICYNGANATPGTPPTNQGQMIITGLRIWLQ